MQDDCDVCMERPRTIRYRPCGHAVCCELCTIKACSASQQRLICPTCRETVAQLELVPNRGQRMKCFQTDAQPGALSYKGVQVFLQAMCDSAVQEVADAARAVHDRWGKPDTGKLEAELLLAAAVGYPGAVTRLLSTAAHGLDVNAVDSDGDTALVTAALRGHTATVTALLAAPDLNVNAASGPGRNVNAANRAGRSALMMAAGGGHTATVTALLAAPSLEVNAGDLTGKTALTWAALGGHTATVAVLLAAGLDVNAAYRAGRTALMLAAGQGHTATSWRCWILVAST